MTRIRQRTDTASGWAAANPILMEGEVGWESNTNKAKRGDGVTAWNFLVYAIEPGAPLASPAFTGNPTAPTPLTEDNDTSIATTAFVKAQDYAPKVSPNFSGNPTAPTQTFGDSDTSIATTAFVQAAIAPKAPLASPALTGNPTAPTPVTSDSDTSIATTAFVKAALLAIWPVGSIYMIATNTNPSTFLGGTWTAWGSGRVPVGVDTAQTEFDTAEETGGAKTVTLNVAQIPAHTHQGVRVINGVTDPALFLALAAPGATGSSTYGLSVTGTQALATYEAGGGGAHQNLQPYITCYMFKRTA